MGEQQITTSKRLVYNTFFNVVTLVSNGVIGFFLVPFFLGRLGEAKYGVWFLIAGSIFHYGPLLSMGLNSAINRYIPVCLAKNDDEGIQRVISTSLFFFFIPAIVLIVATVVVYYNLGSWFAIRPELVPVAETLLLVVGFCFACAMPLQSFSAVLSGLQRYDIINLAILSTLLARSAILVILLSRGCGLLTMGVVFGLSEILMRTTQFIFAKKLLPQFSFSLTKVDFPLLREMLTYGMNTFLYAAGAAIICWASSIVIGVFIGESEVSQFGIVTYVVLFLSQFLQALTAAIKPAVSDLDARDDQLRVKEISFLTQKYSLLLLIPGGCFLVAMGREFLWIWVGGKSQAPSVIDEMAVILAILAVGHCLMLAQYSNFLVLVGRGEHKIFGILTALMAIFSVFASVVAVKVLDWGLPGIAWSNFLPMALISGIILPIYFNWKMRISFSESARTVWRPALLGSLPGVAVITLWKYVAAPNSWPELIAVVIAASLVTLVSGWFLSLEEVERKRFAQIALRRQAPNKFGG